MFASLPGAGEAYPPRLLVAFGADRGRWQSAEGLACFAGVAPVIERSGQSTWVRWRYFCPKFVRQSFIEYAGESLKHSLRGQGVLRVAAGEGQEPSRGGAGAGLQMDQDHLPVLADADALQRGEVPGGLTAEGVAAAQLCGAESRLI